MQHMYDKRLLKHRMKFVSYSFEIYKHIMQSQLHNAAKDTSDIARKVKLAFFVVLCPRGNPS